MDKAPRHLRVLYSFPHKLGADRICLTAYKQVEGLVAAGAEMLVFPGALEKALPKNVRVQPTLARGSIRIPYRLLGTKRACALHDYIVAQRLPELVGKIDLIHAWPMGALRTLRTAARLGIPTVLERPNCHTRFAYEVVQAECERLGVPLPAGHEHAYKADWLRVEETEYSLPTRLLCPSDFVAKSFLARGYPEERLARHQYGYDENVFHARDRDDSGKRPFTALFVGGCAPRKGLHYALEAWQRSSAVNTGIFLVAGEFVPGYRERLQSLLSLPSVKLLGHRQDVPKLMRDADVLILPTIEEGSALVTYEARGSGCVLLVSNAAGAICTHGVDGLIHKVGDVAVLAEHISMLHADREKLNRLRSVSLTTVDKLTWRFAGCHLFFVYAQVVDDCSRTGEEMR